MKAKTISHFVQLLLCCILLAGCQPKVYLMPSPVAMKSGAEIFEQTLDSEDDLYYPHAKDENFLHTLYATNRQPADSVNKSGVYSILPSDTLRLGFTVHRVGDEGMSWEEVLEQSVTADRRSKLLLSSEYTREIALRELTDDLETTSSQEDGFFAELNTLLDKTYDKDILVYVHGANCNFYRATAQGAQLFHFTGHNSIVMTYSWPSAENILKYKTDVLHAKKTVPAFARLIELLAKHTKARNINILAYSAGAQVAAPGLAYFHDQYPDESKEDLRKRLRIGEVYFAAPDTAFKPFVERYLKFKDIVQRTTINLNKHDAVLRLSAFQNGVARLGRPDETALTEDERNILIEAMDTPYLNVLDVGDSKPLDLGKAHDSWYNHPWVSMDVFLLILLNLNPLERGLEEFWINDVAKTYRFPENYDTNIRKIIDEQRLMYDEKIRLEHEQFWQ